METRTCHFCRRAVNVDAYCANCATTWSKRPDPATMTPEERAIDDAYANDHAARLGRSVGKKLMDEIIDLAGEGSEIATKASALSDSDREAIGEILAESLVKQDPIRQALWDLKAMGGTVTVGTSDDPHVNAIYDRLKAAQKGATSMVTAEKPKTDTRQLVTGGNPDDLFAMPRVIQRDAEFGNGSAIERIADALIASPEHGLSHLVGVEIGYLWKAKGGKSKGRPVFSRTVKLAGLAAYYGEREFVVWIACDSVDAAALTNWQMEAQVYHELSSIRVAKTDDDDAKETLAIVGPDVQENHDVIRLYGEWNYDIQRAADVLQGRLAL